MGEDMRVQKRIELRDDEVVMVKLNQAPFSIRLVCCDCGLTHDIKILQWEQLDNGVEVEMILHRNKRSTLLNRGYRIRKLSGSVG